MSYSTSGSGSSSSGSPTAASSSSRASLAGSSFSGDSSSTHAATSHAKANASGNASSRQAVGQHNVGNARPSTRPPRGGKLSWKNGPKADAQKAPDPILFQTYFKSVGPRTYAAQLKRAGNGNHYLVFTEGKRDKVTDEVRKTSLYVFSEDFISFFKMLKETAEHVKSHPVPAEVAQKRTRFWQKQNSDNSKSKPADGRSKR